MTKLLLVFLGGGVGSILRYLVGMLTCQFGFAGRFPWATLACNVLGCLLIGLFNALAGRLQWDAELRLMLTVGLCGGFTTFSNFSNEGIDMMQSGCYVLYAAYAVMSILLGFEAVIAGMYIGNL